MPFLIVEQLPKYGHGSASFVRRGEPSITDQVGTITDKVIPLDSEEVVVGRDAVGLRTDHPDADVIYLISVSINRYHARIRRIGGRYVLEDRQSRNGVFVNDIRVNSAILNDGDRIRITEFEFVFRVEGTESLDTNATVTST